MPVVLDQADVRLNPITDRIFGNAKLIVQKFRQIGAVFELPAEDAGLPLASLFTIAPNELGHRL